MKKAIFVLSIELLIGLLFTNCSKSPPEVCIPYCDNKQCGYDGCYGSCGNCENDLVCNNVGQCVPHDCVPNCEGRQCGSDGCFSACGECGSSLTCNDLGQCMPIDCIPNCQGRQCGPDGCAGVCGECNAETEECDGTGQCIKKACVPQCEGRQCGDDGCDGVCGECDPETEDCGSNFQCIPKGCVPDCGVRICGPNGCDGSCGDCNPETEICDLSGQCVPKPCEPNCEGKQCGPDGCEGICGECNPKTESCDEQDQCVLQVCVTDCEGKQCGPDGCNGFCDECPEPENQYCDSQGQCQIKSSCTPQCFNHQCGSDSCNGGCGPGCQVDELCTGIGFCEAVPNPYNVPPTFGVNISDSSWMVSYNDLACFKNYQINHIGVDLTIPHITRQQIQQALDVGMTVDAYIYLYWTSNFTTQVQEAVEAIADLPVRHFWLELKADPGSKGSTELANMIQSGLDICSASIPCGIYTNWNFWTEKMNNTTAFSNVPLWYTHYDQLTNMDDWKPTPIPGSFGGWTQPAAKQYTNTMILCGISVDRNIFYLDPIPVDELHPLAPSSLSPISGTQTESGPVTLYSNGFFDSILYEFEIWHYGGQWFEFNANHPIGINEFMLSPPYPDTRYRWRVRARNEHGLGHWSGFSTLTIGTEAGANDPPPPPRGLFPSNNVVACPEQIKLSCNQWPETTGHIFSIQNKSGSNWVKYYEYPPTSSNFKKVAPVIDDADYRFQVKAINANGESAYSDWAYFHFMKVCPGVP